MKQKPTIKVSKKMTNSIGRPKSNVAEYLEIFNTDDHAACMKYITKCFGDVTSEDHDKEGLAAFASEVEAAVAAKDAAENAAEAVTEETSDATNA
jgi:hypothetical protein